MFIFINKVYMKLPKREKIKNSDIHIRIAKSKHENLKKICYIKNITITEIIEQHINQLEEKYCV
jgi:hypothetical protein